MGKFIKGGNFYFVVICLWRSAMDTLIILYWLGNLIFLNGAGMPTADNQLGFQKWERGLLTYGHRENISEVYDIDENTEILGIYESGKTQKFELGQVQGLNHLEYNEKINEVMFLLNGEWTLTSDVIKYFSSPDSITIYTCYPKSGELLGGLFIELIPIIE
jgi:hypothetical protein